MFFKLIISISNPVFFGKQTNTEARRFKEHKYVFNAQNALTF